MIKSKNLRLGYLTIWGLIVIYIGQTLARGSTSDGSSAKNLLYPGKVLCSTKTPDHNRFSVESLGISITM
jgi:hypothetical protein